MERITYGCVSSGCVEFLVDVSPAEGNSVDSIQTEDGKVSLSI